MKLCLKGKLSNFKDKYAAFQLIYSLPVSPSIALHPEGYMGTKKLFFSLDIYALQCHLHPIKKNILFIFILYEFCHQPQNKPELPTFVVLQFSLASATDWNPQYWVLKPEAVSLITLAHAILRGEWQTLALLKAFVVFCLQ